MEIQCTRMLMESQVKDFIVVHKTSVELRSKTVLQQSPKQLK